MENIPDILYEKLTKQYDINTMSKIIEGYNSNRCVTFRINTIKTTKKDILEILKENDIEFEELSWYNDAIIIKNKTEKDLVNLDIYKEGKIYLQSLSSMMPALILEPNEGENILDMTAAPGGKTTQIAALSNNKSLIMATEKNKIRYDRLKYNIDKQGASKVTILREDARYLDDYFSFDKILLDAPCSGSGTILTSNNNEHFTEELLNRIIKTQTELLNKALKLLKKDHTMIYSTCSILSEENENQLINLINNKKIEIIPIDDKFENIEKLPTKIEGTVAIMPNALFEGFFIAKIKKL